MSIIPDPFKAKVKLAVRVKDGQLELFEGVPFPLLREGALGDLSFLSSAFGKDPIVAWLRYDGEVEVLPEGKKLLVGINPKDTPGELTDKHFALKDTQRSISENPPWMHYVEVILEESLVLLLHGTDKPTLANSQCAIPALEKEAESVNQAYSLVSTAFEPTRRAHTGNAFERVFYQNENGSWVPLDHLRDEVEALLEQRVRFAWLYRAVAIEANAYPACATVQLGLLSEADDWFANFVSYLKQHEEPVYSAFNQHYARMLEVEKPPIGLESIDWSGWNYLAQIATKMHATQRQLVSVDGFSEVICQSLVNIWRLVQVSDIFLEYDVRNMMEWATSILDAIWKSHGSSAIRTQLLEVFERLNADQRQQLLQHAQGLQQADQ